MTATWILTIGSSDIVLTEEIKKKLHDYYSTISKQIYNITFDAKEIEDEKPKLYAIPIRVLGEIYQYLENNHVERSNDFYRNLKFPLLDRFSARLKANPIEPDRIIIILTDQSHIFPDNKSDRRKKCPFWQDTCTVQSLLEKYISEKFSAVKPEFITLQPELQPEARSKGLDDWDSVLALVSQQLAKVVLGDETVYISHQAGTPAISSALQFVSLGRFGSRVQFLVSNEYEPQEAEVLASYSYLRGIQIQQAKQLILDGLPGAALHLLEGINYSGALFEKLTDIVAQFNIKAQANTNEFEPNNAIKRVRDALDLIEIFFEQENYLQGVTLLAAAQETFLKAAIVSFMNSIDRTVGNIPVCQLMTWDNSGLYFKSKQQLEAIAEFDPSVDATVDLASLLHFPKPQQRNKEDKDFDWYNFFGKYLYQDSQHWHDRFNLDYICHKDKGKRGPNKTDQTILEFKFNLANHRLLKWVQELVSQKTKLHNWEWELLNWSCTYIRNYEDDRRNQLMHNLRGMEVESVLTYLYGYSKNEGNIDTTESVATVYIREIKAKFSSALYRLKLIENDSADNLLKAELKKIANSLDADRD